MQSNGINNVVKAIHDSAKEYLESNYHISSHHLIEERNLLLNDTRERVITQIPYIEATPSYKLDKKYSELELPKPVKEMFVKLVEYTKGRVVYPAPYIHQYNSIQKFVIEDKDILVATGTGSGKTECFLYPILSQLVLEAENRNNSFLKPGMRALVLYPMNALVGDQVSRLRKILGNKLFVKDFINKYGRQLTFGMYTGRVHYAGERSEDKDLRYKKTIGEFYKQLKKNNEENYNELIEKGKIPAKDLDGFFDRLQTQSEDSELIMRQEIQNKCPDILITNYSMLEYMLMRPIERSIFAQTTEWLNSNPNNKFILVLDEAHMYRGSGGAEVGLLIRRLQARLGIDRDRVKCVLTSASLKTENHADIVKALEFAKNLTGTTKSPGYKGFEIIHSQKEKLTGIRKATTYETDILAAFDINIFEKMLSEKNCCLRDEALNEINTLLIRLKIYDHYAVESNYSEVLFDTLSNFGPAKLLIRECTNIAKPLDEIYDIVFEHESSDTKQKAFNTLIALMSASVKNEKVLLPARVHLFYRGIEGLYVCIDPNCTLKRYKTSTKSILGRMYTNIKLNCDCKNQGRVFELLTHRKCGGAFIKAYYKECDYGCERYIWHEKGYHSKDELTEVHIYIPDGETDKRISELVSDKAKKHRKVYIHIPTGFLEWSEPDNLDDYIMGIWPKNNKKASDYNNRLLTFATCPYCDSSTFYTPISELSTGRGDTLFANIIKSQHQNQKPIKESSRQNPNQGKKVLVFSDGRQKAAKLARDLPRIISRDSFRQVVIIAASYLNETKIDWNMKTRFYIGVLKVLQENNLLFFDTQDRMSLKKALKKYTQDVEDEETFEDIVINTTDMTLTDQYKEALYFQLINPNYSVYSTCCGYLTVIDKAKRNIIKNLKNIFNDEFDIVNLINIGILYLLEYGLYDSEMSSKIKGSVLGKSFIFKKARLWEGEEPLERIAGILENIYTLTPEGIAEFKTVFYKYVCTSDNDGIYYINPDSVKLNCAVDSNWFRCKKCRKIIPFSAKGQCIYCDSQTNGLTLVEELSPNDKYISTRKDYWREPIRNVLKAERPIQTIQAQEHSAQLSQTDNGNVFTTTEKYELEFQDIIINTEENKNEVVTDILSCTTTMEVGIDIGSLTGVALRNVPPSRENYQQRAGRAGRRGASVSTVITFADGGPHDGYYFDRANEMISGDVRDPRIYIDNVKIIKRHINAFLLQTFFHENISSLSIGNNLLSSFGNTNDFYGKTGEFTLLQFKKWCKELLFSKNNNYDMLTNIIPNEMANNTLFNDKARIISDAISEMIDKLISVQPHENTTCLEDTLLEFLFKIGVLPAYSFPVDLASFYIEHVWKGRRYIKEQPQLSMLRAINEYAPGRQIVVDKKTYISGGIYIPYKNYDDNGKVKRLGEKSNVCYCSNCSFTIESKRLNKCPICKSKLSSYLTLKPIGFAPYGGTSVNEFDDSEEKSYSIPPQYPQPEGSIRLDFKKDDNCYYEYTSLKDEKLLTINRGVDDRGYYVCKDCGAAFSAPDYERCLEQSNSSTIVHRYPFPSAMHMECRGKFENVALGYSFLSDIFLMRISFSESIEQQPSIWLISALRTFTETFIKASSIVLDIDYFELGGGFRFNASNQSRTIDMYIYDTTTGGAGYSSEISGRTKEIFEKMYEVLACDCERACYKCLKHYGNQMEHSKLHRKLGLDMLNYIHKNEIPKFINLQEAGKEISQLEKALKKHGYIINDCTENNLSSMVVTKNENKLKIIIFSSILDFDSISHFEEKDFILIREYDLWNDLPKIIDRVDTHFSQGF